MRKTYTGLITKLERNQVFVFGSNMSGFHGGGAAGFATFNEASNWRDHDYHLKPYGYKGCWNEKGVAEGVQYGTIGGSYALPTIVKPGLKRSRTKDQIINSIKELYEFAELSYFTEFLIAYTGEGRNLNGYTNQEMADMFKKAGDIPPNIVFEREFNDLIFDSFEDVFDVDDL